MEPPRRDPSKSWIEDESFFHYQYLTGKQYERFVLEKLSGYGISPIVHVDASFRSSVSEIKGYTKRSGDLLVKGYRFEVKSRNAPFQTPDDCRFWPMFVDTVSGYDQKEKKPLGYIFVSQATGALMAVSTRTRFHWGKRRRYDRERMIEDEFYVADRELVYSEQQLVEKLLALESRSVSVEETVSPVAGR